jgi:hypothetical protein
MGMWGLSMGMVACSDDPVTTETGEDVTVQGVVSDPDGVPQEGLFTHIVYGPTAAPIGVADDETDAQGQYSVSGKVPADQCHAVQIWVLETGIFSAAAARLARETVGACGTTTLNIEVEGAGPVS